MYFIVFTKQALRDQKKIKGTHIEDRVRKVLNDLKVSPKTVVTFKRLVNDLEGAFSVRVNIKHRIVFRINESTKTIMVLTMWGHYNDQCYA